MPSQQTFFSETSEGKQIDIVKTYDRQLAREAFEEMDAQAMDTLAKALILEGLLEPEEVGDLDDEGLWQGIEEGSRENWNTFSYFIVQENIADKKQFRFVCSGWPTAEAFAKTLLKPAER